MQNHWASGRGRRAALLAGLIVATALAGGCGEGSTEDTAGSTTPSEMPGMSGMPGMPGMNMGDPSATPANQIAGADLKEGTFQLLDTRPPRSDNVTGTAWLAQNDQGTTVTVRMTGLSPGQQYISHLHTESCSPNSGGLHFQFDTAGPTVPPNEVHLAFTGGPDGTAMMTAHNDRKVGDGAKAIVVHPSDAIDNKLACADF